MDRPTSWGPLLVSPLRFWLGAGAFLLVAGAMAYGYGAWYAGVLLQDAVAVREVAANSSWTARFQYEEVDGIRRRVELPGPDGLGTAVEVDDLTTADPASAGYATYGAVLKELGNEKDDEEKKKEEEGRGLSREELLRTLRQAGVMLNEVDTSSWRETVEVGSGLSADEARKRAEEFRKTGRDVEVESYRDPSGSTRYRLNYGRVRTREEAAALENELREAGLVQGGGEAGPSSDGGAASGGADTGGPTGPGGGAAGGGATGGGSTGGGGASGGGGTTSPPTTPPAGGGGPRSVTDL